MKKLILLLVAATLSLGTVSAQKLSKAEKKAQKEAAMQANIKRLAKIFIAQDLTFTPTEMQTNTSGRTSINQFEYFKLTPDLLDIEMSYLSEDRSGVMREKNTGPGDKGTTVKKIVALDVNTKAFTITKNESTKTGHMMVLEVNANQQKFTMTMEANAKSNITSLKIKSNKNSEVIYKGTIREN